MSTSDEDDADPETYYTLMLLIGRPVLASEWETIYSITRLTIWEEIFLADRVVTYSTPPYLNRQAANQLLPTLTPYEQLVIRVSLLELNHHQIVDILEGVTILLESASEDRFTVFTLECEQGNPEHDDAIELARAYDDGAHTESNIATNSRRGANSLLPNEGDDGLEIEVDGVEDEDDEDS